METMEEFFKNRIFFFNTRHHVFNHGFIHDFKVKRAFTHESKIHNPLSLNITNTFDLVEKLTLSLYFVLSD